MILEANCQVIVGGEDFDPNLLIIPDRIRIIQKGKKGDIVEFGRDKANMSSKGYLLVDGHLDDVIFFVNSELKSLLASNKVELNICIVVKYKNECNFELSPEHLEFFKTLGIPLGITCHS